MTVHVLVNARAGTVLDWENGPLADEIASAFRARGQEVALRFIPPDALPGAIAAVLSGPCDALIVGGGDGTVRAAARALIGSGVPLGILPLGTMNRLARDLNMPLTVPEAAGALAAGRTARIDVADVNGRIFLCNSLFGPPALYSAQRQALRGRPLMERVKGYVSVVMEMLRSRRRVDVDGRAHDRGVGASRADAAVQRRRIGDGGDAAAVYDPAAGAHGAGARLANARLANGCGDRRR